jgi:hypothetical protein
MKERGRICNGKNKETNRNRLKERISDRQLKI